MEGFKIKLTNPEEQKPAENTSGGEDNGARLSEAGFKVMECLRDIMPYLDTNCENGTQNYNDGKWNELEYGYMMVRYQNANVAVSAVDFETQCVTDNNIAHIKEFEKRLTDTAAWCIIDLRDHINLDLQGEAKLAAETKLQELTDLLKAAGYNKMNPLYKIPYKQ